MADQTLHSPTNPHFFQPLLPGFETHLNLPLAFFVKHVQGSYDHIKTAKLRTDASDNTVLVKIDGMKLTEGWKDFAVAQDLRIGDILIFRHEGDMVFHVTPFGPSCCDIQYTAPSSGDINNDGHDHTTYNTGGTGSISSLTFDYCFLAEVTASNKKEDKLSLPVQATNCTALNQQCQETILVNKDGKSWKVSLRFSQSGGNYYITRGWRKFTVDNRCEIGEVIIFNVVGDGKTTPLLCVCPERKADSEFLGKDKHLRRKSGEYYPLTSLSWFFYL
ncbi:B3 domain-containing protein REM10 [Raphanus sativus]|nr:B3 domain-containing protein REM10 [Raphanus sativus]